MHSQLNIEIVFCLNRVCVATAALYKRFFVFVIITAILGKLGEKMFNVHFSHIILFCFFFIISFNMHVNRYDLWWCNRKGISIWSFGVKKNYLFLFYFAAYITYELNRVHCLEFLKQNYCISHIFSPDYNNREFCSLKPYFIFHFHSLFFFLNLNVGSYCDLRYYENYRKSVCVSYKTFMVMTLHNYMFTKYF